MPPKKTKTKPDVAKPDAPRIDERHTCYKLVIAPSAIHRWGVYAGEAIPAKRKLMEYTGERCNRTETKRRAGGSLNYMFTLNSYWALDGTVGGSGAEYVNHSCDPNCYAWIFKDHILYMTKRPIKKGEEITLDYHFAKDVDRVPCSCGSAKCRGTINLK